MVDNGRPIVAPGDKRRLILTLSWETQYHPAGMNLIVRPGLTAR